MSDDYATVNAKGGGRGREIEALRKQYRQHRDALARMIADAPTEHLAAEYQKLLREIDGAVAKLDELEGRTPTSPGTSPGTRPLVTTLADDDDTIAFDSAPPPPPDTSAPAAQGSRVLLIVVAGVIVLAAILWLLWRASGDRNPRNATPVTEQTSTTAPLETAPPVQTTTTAAPPAAAGIKITPAAADYGTIRKGTRAVRQFTIENLAAAAVPLRVARSTCRCLFYDYVEKVPAHGKETITVTVDGARAKVGELHETVQVTSKDDPSVSAAFTVNATIK